jgi:hypothetical protein
MKELEREAALGTEHRRFTSRDPGDPESFKTRVGKVGGYREYLADADIAYIEERIAARLPKRLGYQDAGVPPEPVRPA